MLASTLALSLLAGGCTFYGYVPKGKHVPVEEAERTIVDLPLDAPTTGELDCAGEGQCRVRYRLVMGRAGRLSISVDGPRAERTDESSRLARVMFQDVNGRTLSRNDPADETGPMTVAAHVESGPYFVLIQGLGPAFEYTVTASLAAGFTFSAKPSSDSGTAAGGAAGTAAGGATAGAAAETTWPPRSPISSLRGTGKHVPGDTSDGADFASDPTVDILAMRSYAFAEDPRKQLEGKEAEGHGDPFVIRAIQREIRYALGDYGIAQVAPEGADYLISVQVGSSATTWYSLNNQIFNTSYQTYFNSWGSMGAFIKPHSYLDGTLVIDFIDPRTEKLVWHGWTTEPVNVNLDRTDILKKAVRTVLAQFSDR